MNSATMPIEGRIETRTELQKILHTLRDRQKGTALRAEENHNRIQEITQQCGKINDFENRLREVDVRNSTSIIKTNSRVNFIEKGIAEMNERRLRMEEHNTRLTVAVHEQGTRVEDLNKKHDQLSDRVEATREDLIEYVTSIRQTPTNIMGSIKLELPTFAARNDERPMHFIKLLKEYIEVMATGINPKYVIAQALKGPAQDWWELIEQRVQSFIVFQACFRQKYWNCAAQSNIRRELEFGFYRANSGLTRGEYTTRLYNKVKMLDDVPSMVEVVEKFSRHFDENIQQSIITKCINNVEQLIRMLDSLDRVGLLNSTLADKSHNSFGIPSWRKDTINSGVGDRMNFKSSTPLPENSRGQNYYNNRSQEPRTYNGQRNNQQPQPRPEQSRSHNAGAIRNRPVEVNEIDIEEGRNEEDSEN